jgi:hypothetical protein
LDNDCKVSTNSPEEAQDEKKASSSVELDKSINADLYEKLKYRVKETILVNFAKASELAETVEPPTHPDTYVPVSEIKAKETERAHKVSNQMIKAIFDSITSVLSTNESHEHLLHAQHATNVDIRAYWMRSGFGEAKPRGAIFPDPDSIRFQFNDIASYQIKCENPIKPVLISDNSTALFFHTYFINSFLLQQIHKIDSKASTEPQVKEYAYTPANFKIFADHTLPMQVPG